MKKQLSSFVISLILLHLIFLFGNNLVQSKGCGMDHLLSKKSHKPQLVKPIGEEGRYLSSDIYEPIRIHLDYSFIERNIGKFEAKDLEALKKYIMPKTKEVFEKILKVKRIKNKLKFNASTCDDYAIPEEYLESGPGVEADLVIFVTIDDSGYFLENEIEAAAIHCLQHSNTFRPIAGYIQFKPNLYLNDTTAQDYLVWLAIHETTHILVMNDGLYGDFIDSSNNKLGISNIIQKSTHPISGKPVNLVKTRKVVEKAREHFGCDSLEGVPLEYNGGPGTAGAHWSKKIMNTDYMIGDSYGENLFSDISLALFKDSGWYDVDFSKSNLFEWGKNEGCSFFSMKCVSDWDKRKEAIKRKSQNNKIKHRLNEATTKSNISKFQRLSFHHNKQTDSNESKDDTESYFNNHLNSFNLKNSSKQSHSKDSDLISLLSKQEKSHKKPSNNSHNKHLNKRENKDNKSQSKSKPSSRAQSLGDGKSYKKHYSAFPKEFCEFPNQEVCSRHNIFRGICSMRTYSTPLPDYESYFGNRYLGGIDSLTDKCPISIENKGKQYYYGGSCRVGEKKNDIEEICPECACFLSSLKKNPKRTNDSLKESLKSNKDKQNEYMNELYQKSPNANRKVTSHDVEQESEERSSLKAMCFKFSCDGGNLTVSLEGKVFKCNPKGITIPGYSGKIMCPDAEILCHEKFLCKFGCTEKYSNANSYKVLRKKT